MVGDHANDIQLAKAAGVKSILVTSGQVDQQALTMLRAAGASTWSPSRWQRRPSGFSQMPPHKQHAQVSLDERTLTNWLRERIDGSLW